MAVDNVTRSTPNPPRVQPDTTTGARVEETPTRGATRTPAEDTPADRETPVTTESRPTETTSRDTRRMQAADLRVQQLQSRVTAQLPIPQPGTVQNGGPAGTQPVVRGEVANESEITGPGQWTTQDRVNNTQRWRDANLYNLEHGNSSRYQRIEERRDFYRWFYQHSVDRGFETRWPLAASVVANGAQQVAYPGTVGEAGAQTTGTISNELQGFMRTGNQVIFDDAFPKLKALLDGPPLRGRDALRWDMQTLSEEQSLVQPMYNDMSATARSQMEAIAKKQGFALNTALFFTSEDELQANHGPDGRPGTADDYNRGGTIPGLPENANLTSIDDRWRYGMGLGRTFAPRATGFTDDMQRPAAPAAYMNGQALARVNTRQNLHMLDGELDAAMGYASISRVQTLLGRLSDAEKAQLALDQRPDGGRYSERLAMMPRVPRSAVLAALPPGPERDAFMARYDRLRPPHLR